MKKAPNHCIHCKLACPVDVVGHERCMVRALEREAMLQERLKARMWARSLGVKAGLVK